MGSPFLRRPRLAPLLVADALLALLPLVVADAPFALPPLVVLRCAGWRGDALSLSIALETMAGRRR